MKLRYYLISIVLIISCSSNFKKEKFANINPIFELDDQAGMQKIYFNSSNPFSFKDIINDLDSQEKQDVFGILRMPTKFKKTQKYPLIIAVAGSNGWSDHHYDYLQMYRENGIATFELCSFQSRGISSTVGTQVEVTTAMMILDSYRAHEILAQHAHIDSENIGITGWSLGGGVALFSAWKPINNAINPEVKFAAHLPIYPPCIVTPKLLDFGDSPIHILIGELDNWTPAAACQELVDQTDNNIELTIYEGAHHSFDSNSKLAVRENGYILEDCRFQMKSDGTVLMNFFNIPMTTPLLQKIGLFMCARRGPTYGRSDSAKVKAFNFSRSFMRTHLY